MTSTIRKVGLRLPARIAFGAAIAIAACQNANADSFTPFVIRNSSVTNATPTITALGGGAYEFVIAQGGQKAALGSNAINGKTVDEIASVKITRFDDRGRFTVGSGPYIAPYLNLWVTDGAGSFAIVAASDVASLYSGGYDLSFADLSGTTAYIYETSNSSWLANGPGHTFSDLANFVIQAPTAAQLTAGWTGLGTGAPRTLGTNEAYGVNWVFGDTASNYISGERGYKVSDAGVSAVPEPGSVALLLTVLGTLGVMTRRRRCA